MSAWVRVRWRSGGFRRTPEAGAPGVPGGAGEGLLPRGKGRAEGCYETVNSGRAGAAETEGYNAAFARLEAGDPKARQAFAALVGQYDEDPLTMFHLGRLLSGETGAEIELTGK